MNSSIHPFILLQYSLPLWFPSLLTYIHTYIHSFYLSFTHPSINPPFFLSSLSVSISVWYFPSLLSSLPSLPSPFPSPSLPLVCVSGCGTPEFAVIWPSVVAPRSCGGKVRRGERGRRRREKREGGRGGRWSKVTGKNSVNGPNVFSNI